MGIFPVMAGTFYFSSVKGDDSRSMSQAQQPGTPWQSLAKLNQIFPQLKPGDSILFKRGDVFYGSIVVGQSGTSGSPIVLASYGQGAEPVISGFSRLSGWKDSGKGIWQAPCQGCEMRVNMVTVEDTVQHMGRYPNTGYLKIQSHVKNTAFTDPNLASGPDWTGADVVIRKNRFILDRNTIVSQQGGTLTFRGGSFYEVTDNFGYFIQNDIRTLDQPGEWYYDPKAKMMNMYFGAVSPPSDILASGVDTLVVIKNRQFLVFNGLQFMGSNGNAFFVSDAANILISYCRILFSSQDGVCSIRTNNLTVANTVVDHSDDDGINLSGKSNLVTDCTVSHTGNVPGMGNGVESYIGVQLEGTNNTVQYCTIDTTGYCGVFFFHSNSTTVKNNKVDYFCFLKDDGGGIYTWSGDIDSAARRDAGVITGNIVLNGITAPDGTDNAHAAISMGIYLDENTSGIDVSGNAVAHCTSGIFVQDTHEATVKNNVIYDNGAQIEIRHALTKGTLKNNDISGNVAVAGKKNQTVISMSSAVSGDVTGFAGLHDNHYAQVAGGAPFFKTVVRQNNNNVQDKGALGDFQSRYGKESNSAVAPTGAAIRFEYNASKTPKTVALSGEYKDPAGQSFQGQMTLQPYAADILIPQ